MCAASIVRRRLNDHHQLINRAKGYKLPFQTVLNTTPVSENPANRISRKSHLMGFGQWRAMFVQDKRGPGTGFESVLSCVLVAEPK